MSMLPADLAKSGSEHGHQTALFQQAKMFIAEWNANGKGICPLDNMFAIPNGDQRGDGTLKGAAIAGNRLKAEGLKAGVPDLMLAWPITYKGVVYHGLFIEMKRPEEIKKKNGGCSQNQLDWHADLRHADYAVVVCYSWEDAWDNILSYINFYERKMS